MSLNKQEQDRIMDYTASLLERVAILTGPLPKHLRRRLYGAIRLLRNRGINLKPRTRGV